MKTYKEESKLGLEFYKSKKYFSSGTYVNTSGEDYDSRAVAMTCTILGMSIAKTDANGELKK